MKEFKNTYDYNLNELKTIYIDENGKIIGGTNCVEKYKKGNKFIVFHSGAEQTELQVLEVKKILIVRETKEEINN